jgi:predicted phage terminase large subunit-like protein
VPDLNRYKQWKPEYQAKALTQLRQAENDQWHPFYCPNTGCNGQPHVWPNDERDCPFPFGHVWRDEDPNGKPTPWHCEHCEVGGVLLDEWGFPHARVDQRPPRWAGDWLTFLMRGGRGSGKTKTGAEITNRVTALTPRIILIAATGPDLRDTMVEGISGILACSAPGKRPEWEPSKKRLTWPNGCIAQGFSAEEPDRLRGPQSGFVWADEPSHWDLVEACWENMLYGLRVGRNPKVVATSTPKPTKWTKDTIAAEDTVDRVVSTYANLGNLADTYKRTVISKFEGTRRGQQELFGELLEDVEGALWTQEMFHWIDEAPSLQRIVVSVDPAGTANKKSDETGIIVIGIGHDKRLYVLEDLTGKYSPNGWATAAIKAVEKWNADAIVAEKNYGGDMVKNTIENVAEDRGTLVRIIEVTSRRGKELRAEPIVGLYEKHKVMHVGARGDLLALEEEQCSWVPHEGPSPNRVDALVHGATHLAKGVMPATVSNPNEVLKHLSSPTARHLRAV